MTDRLRAAFAVFRAVGLLCLSWPAMAQDETDALRIGTVRPGGTARSNGMANAFGALGADPAAAAINPAGLALYTTSELSLTPSFEVNQAQSTHYGTNATDTRSRMFFSNLALVLHQESDKGTGWRGSTYGMVYDRMESYHWRTLAVGERVPSTILQGFADEAFGTRDSDLFNSFPFTAGLAWETFGINPDFPLTPGGDTIRDAYAPAVPFGSPTRQTRSMATMGNSNNTAFFYSANYEDRFYIGGSIGIAGHRYERTTEYRETTLDETLDLQELAYDERVTISGSGLDIKFGILGRLTPRLRAGAAFHSPRWLRLTDSYAYAMRTRFRTPDANGRSTYSAESPDGVFTYRLNSPWRAVLSMAYVAGKHGLVSLDYEYADLATTRFRRGDQFLNNYSFDTENRAIENSLRPLHSVRVGTEWRFGPWYYRLGWSLVPDGFRTDDARAGRALKIFAGGVGYRSDHFSLELALNYAQRSNTYFMYAPWTVEPTTETRSAVQSFVTIGFRP
jgi:hypothetical protein